MKYENYLIYGALIVVLSTLVFAIFGFPSGGAEPIVNAPKTTASESGFKSIDTGDTGPGGVSVELIPEGIVNGKLIISSAINTHSVDLTQFNLNEIMTLEYDGKIIKPDSAPELMGHHSGGDIVFDVGEDIKEFTIKIVGIPKVDERVFSWN